MLQIIQPDTAMIAGSCLDERLLGLEPVAVWTGHVSQTKLKHKPPGNEPQHDWLTSDPELCCFVPMAAGREACSRVRACGYFSVSISVSAVYRYEM